MIKSKKAIYESMVSKMSKINESADMTIHDVQENMKELMGADALLEELVQSLSNDELEEHLRWIAKMNDIDVF